MRPTLQFCVPCFAYDDGEGTKPPSFQYIFYELPFPQFPAKFPDPGFIIAVGWTNGQGDFTQAVNILSPDKRTPILATGNQPLNLSDQSTPRMGVFWFKDAAFKEPGTYWVQTCLNGEPVLEIPLPVRLAEAPAK